MQCQEILGLIGILHYINQKLRGRLKSCCRQV
jgi:hypothetical protein